MKSSFREGLAHILPTSSSPNVLRGCQFLRFWSANRGPASVLCTFCRQLSQIEAWNRGNRDPTLATAGATLPEKRRVSHSRVFSPMNSHASELLLYSSLVLLHAKCSCSLCWHDLMTKTTPGHSSVTGNSKTPPCKQFPGSRRVPGKMMVFAALELPRLEPWPQRLTARWGFARKLSHWFENVWNGSGWTRLLRLLKPGFYRWPAFSPQCK